MMSEEQREQAAAWFARLRSPEVTSADRHAFNLWLEQDLEHELAYARVEQAWRDLGQLETWARGELGQLHLRSVSRSRRRLLVGALAVAASFAAAVSWFVIQNVLPLELIEIQTAKAERREVALKDGTRVHLNTGTDVEVRLLNTLREVVIKRGEGLFDVNHDENRPFVVRAGNCSIFAVGTRFAVRLMDDGEWTVTVVEGRIAVLPGTSAQAEAVAGIIKAEGSTRPGHNGMLVDADQMIRIKPSGELKPIESVNAEDVTSWEKGVLKFQRAPLRRVVREISRYIPGEVRVAAGVPDYPVTGIIQIRNVDTMVNLLGEVVPVTGVKNSSEVTVLYDSR